MSLLRDFHRPERRVRIASGWLTLLESSAFLLQFVYRIYPAYRGHGKERYDTWLTCVATRRPLECYNPLSSTYPVYGDDHVPGPRNRKESAGISARALLGPGSSLGGAFGPGGRLGSARRPEYSLHRPGKDNLKGRVPVQSVISQARPGSAGVSPARSLSFPLRAGTPALPGRHF